MKKFYVFYLRYPGFGSSWKCGISSSSSIWSRIGSYQNAFGPEYKEQWNHIWVGTEKQIRFLESKFKERFEDKIIGGDAGFSEWITKTNEDELLEAVRYFREDYFIKFIDVPSEFKPLNKDLIAPLKEWALSIQ
jgi:hypothetical protein